MDFFDSSVPESDPLLLPLKLVVGLSTSCASPEVFDHLDERSSVDDDPDSDDSFRGVPCSPLVFAGAAVVLTVFVPLP